MDKEMEKLSRSRKVATETVFEAFKILKENEGRLSGKEVINKIRERLEFSEWEKETYEKSGYVRWESILHFFTIDCIKAGYLRKSKGVWYLTSEGEKALELGKVKLLETATKRYRDWADNQKKEKNNVNLETEEELALIDKDQFQSANLERVEEQAIDGIKKHINNLNPYQFQDLVATLLKAMGYHVPFISPKGKDGGIDIVAYRDPLGALEPRIKIQVKHKPESSISVNEIRSLMGLLNKTGDIGLFVTSGTFTSESMKDARVSQTHVRLIDIVDFIALWQEYYPKMTDEDKKMLPLQPIYFLGVND